MGISKLGQIGKWVEIASSSPTSGTTVSFTSVPKYKDLRIQAFNLNASTLASFSLRFNNDSTTNYAWNMGYDNGTRYIFEESAATTRIQLTNGNIPATFNSTIEGADEACKNVTTWNVMSSDSGVANGLWFNTDTIDRVDLTILTGPATFSSGTIKLFGRN